MQDRRLLPRLLPLFVFAACTQDQPPTAPAEPGGPVHAHTAGHKIVNSLADPGNGACNATQCTLREAINDPQSTEISFAPGLTGAITLAAPAAGGGTLTIDKNLSITGPSTGIVIRRRSTDPDFRIFRIPAEGNVTLTNLTIQNGKRTDRPGAGILNFGTLRLTNSTVADNSGGGIGNFGTLTLTRSTVARNSGGIGNFGMLTVTITNSTIADNSPGLGISNGRGTLALTRSTVARNGGAGITNEGGTLTLTHSTVARNGGAGVSSRGLFRVRAVVTLTNARIVGNSGGGITNSRGSVTLTNSTVAGNSAADGGGIHNSSDGGVTITNSTIAGNSATNEGGGIFNEARVRHVAFVTLTNSTVSGNSAGSGGGIFTSNRGEFDVGVSLTNSTVVSNSATVEGGGGIRQRGADAVLSLGNTIVARNGAPTGPDVFDTGELVGASFSLIGDGSGSGITNTDGNQVGSASAPIDPKVGPLANNGGPTQTHALLLGSPAIDAASTPDCPSTDQRGVLRPQGPACDIGSFERAVQ
jgi:CSLREA domain-containing protein